MTKWIVVAGIGVFVVVLLGRRWSPLTRAAADDAFGRRHYVMVKFWRVWLLCLAAAAVLVAVAVATAPGKTSAGGQRPAAPAVSPSTVAGGGGHAAGATPVPTVPVAAAGDDAGGGIPPLAIAGVCVAAAVGLLAVAMASRARGRREVDEFMALDGEYLEIDEDDAAGTAGETEDDDDDDDDDNDDEDDEGADELVDSGAGGTVHDLSRRRRAGRRGR
jgi:hypothetical protein